MVLQAFAFPERTGYAVGFEERSWEARDARYIVARSRRSTHRHYEKYC